MNDVLIYAVTSLDAEKAKTPDIVFLSGEKEEILCNYQEEKRKKESENSHVSVLISSIT